MSNNKYWLRQNGRLKPDNVINTETNYSEIIKN